MKTLEKISSALGGVVIFVGKAASWLVVPLVLIVVFDVVTRKIDFIKRASADITIEYGFSVSFIAQDLQWHLHGVLALCTFGYAYMMNAHVRVDIFREMASRRRQAWIEIGGIALASIFVFYMILFAWDFTYASYRQGEGSESMVGIGNRFFIKSFLIWGFALVMIAMIAMLLRCIAFLYGDQVTSRDAERAIPFFTDAQELPKLKMNPDGSVSAEGVDLDEV